ncbi:MAG: carboxypeptidase-like regulatory domain-containing protein, partial [Sphingobacterium sp.]
MLILFAIPSYSQQGQKVIRGTVKSVEGTPIEGASVLITKTKQGTSTDVDGKFELEATFSNTETLTITHAAYQTQTVSIINQELQIIMQANAEDLDEVVVVGYGTQKRKDLTGSVAS